MLFPYVVNAQTLITDAEFEIVKYNHPSLAVDLGVGLWAYPLPMDFDGDGDMDLLVSCASKPYNGLYFFENTTGEDKPIFAPGKRLMDGIPQLHGSHVGDSVIVSIPGAILRDFPNALDQSQLPIDVKAPGQWRFVDYDGDGDLDLVTGETDWTDYGWDNAFDSLGNWTKGPLHGYVSLLEHVDGNYVDRGKVMAGGRPVDTYGLPAPNFADFDGDGDLDLICGEFRDTFTWFENTGTREHPVYAGGRPLKNDDGVIQMDLQMIIPVAVDWDQDGHVDLVVGDEDGRVAWVRNTGALKDGTPVFEPPYYFKQVADDLKFGVLATPVSVDWDDDGDEDLVAGNSAGHIGFIENLGGFPPKWAAPALLEVDGTPIRIQAGQNGSIQGPAEEKWGYTTLSVADWDGDGLNDIIINSIWGKVEWFKNIGAPGEPRLSAKQPVAIQWENDLPLKPEWVWWQPGKHELVTQWRTTPYAIDWNSDGLMDLVLLDHEGYLAFFERFRTEEGLFLKPGQRIFYGVNGDAYNSWNRRLSEKDAVGPLRLNAETAGKSGRRKFTFVDWDDDGDLDLVANALNAVVFENLGVIGGNVQLRNIERVTNLRLAGHTNSATIVNWRGAGKKDLLIGASDGHFYYIRRK